MNRNLSRILFVFFGILAWLSTMFLFILPTLTPYQKYIESQNGISEGWLVVILIIITIFYLGILALDLFNSFATQVLQFVLLVLIVVCALPFITAFIIISFIVNISIIEIFIPIILVILAMLLHIVWCVIPFMQSRSLKEAQSKVKR
ncbi:hypothetical protein N9R04_08110 [Staphylococcus sp. SQ8-PEA]|uniref:DUF4064 domain-containing protein n=1 Tax=Staphylococcus marylandisciuri TaxID=2981529 RepID=A0ABT2QRU4_9STAP|nr:hypothetical protein [Staphylococcus marylandisciuri]MCU5746672.1 hypothetical protein [Staphylococcus marylandisciuri]